MLRLIVDLNPADPALGLALDEALLESAKNMAADTLRLWVNDHSVIIGRSQSVACEVDLPHLRKLHIPVIRRISGGGAVYHYPGNLNMSLYLKNGRTLGSVSEVYATIGEAIATALSKHSIDARVEGNIITVGGEKIAGTAQARRGGSLLYHMSLLVFPSQVPIESLLFAMQGSYEPTRVASHPRPVTSLSEVSPGLKMESLVQTLSDEMAGALEKKLQLGTYTGEEMERATQLRTQKYRRDEWNLSH
ncbi:MAG TPA: lipoate--protein ligase family protein [Candidatus Acetothermia bacterium]|nr:lipoate--protein ligase family protein [Candidatus Acetothermia bacterium]